MKKLVISCAMLGALAACQTTDNVVRNTNVNLLSLAKPQLAAGDSYAYYRNGDHEIATVSAVGDDVYSFEVTDGPGDGCTYVGEGFLAPDIQWANCDSSTGTHRNGNHRNWHDPDLRSRLQGWFEHPYLVLFPKPQMAGQIHQGSQKTWSCRCTRT